MRLRRLPASMGAAGAALGLLVATAVPVYGQDDVELLGARWGTPVPESYRALRAADPAAFTFDRAWMARNPRLELVETGGRPEVREVSAPFDGAAPGAAGKLRAGATPARRAVEGRVAFPLFLGLYSDDGPAPFTRDEIHRQFFAGPNPNGTIPDFYDEISGGRVQLEGETLTWSRTALTRAQVTGGVSGLGGASRVGEFITQLLVAADGDGVDWGRWDNDGPDGIPNSGDDDGYVDVIAVMHADPGGECGGTGAGERVWSHRWSLRAATGQAYVTSTPSANGGRIRVSDYTIQPAFACGGSAINEIGVFAHELGHGLGLPDLYAVGDGVSPDHQGIGNWGLMGTGSWGCANSNPARPCHMSAWSKEFLGWADIEELPPEADAGVVRLPAVESSGRIWRVPIPGTEEYWLIENRQPIGYDAQLRAAGLLIWHIDDAVVREKRSRNRINSDPTRMGVRLVEADGMDDLRSPAGNRSDEGDPFPGARGRTAFHAGSEPAARARDGRASGLTLRDLVIEGTDAVFRMETRTRGLTIRTEGASGESLVRVAGVPVASGGTVRVAPFDRVEVVAAAGHHTEPGVRTPFLGWGDGESGHTRSVEVGDDDVELVANFAGEQVRLDVTLRGGAYGVAPGRVVTTPASADLWFERGTSVAVRAESTPGFEFTGWGGPHTGSTGALELDLSSPQELEANFAYTWRIESDTRVELAGGDEVALMLETGSANGAVSWSIIDGSLPEGLRLTPEGRITGTVLDLGSFAVRIYATDEVGLQAAAEFTLDVARPQLDTHLLAAPFIGDDLGPTLGQQVWLDRQGNGDTRYDLVDMRVYLRSSPAAARQTTGRVERTLHLGPPGTSGPGGGR